MSWFDYRPLSVIDLVVNCVKSQIYIFNRERKLLSLRVDSYLFLVHLIHRGKVKNLLLLLVLKSIEVILLRSKKLWSVSVGWHIILVRPRWLFLVSKDVRLLLPLVLTFLTFWVWFFKRFILAFTPFRLIFCKFIASLSIINHRTVLNWFPFLVMLRGRLHFGGWFVVEHVTHILLQLVGHKDFHLVFEPLLSEVHSFVL